MISIGALNTDYLLIARLLSLCYLCYEAKVSLQPPESAEQTFHWAWCCGNDGQNGRHLRELSCNFIKAFSCTTSMISAAVFIGFWHVFSWIDWAGVGLPEVANCQTYRKKQLGQSYHWQGNHLEWRHLMHKEHLWSFPLNQFSISAWTLSRGVKKVLALW